MELLEELLLEKPLPVYLALLVAEAILAAVWLRRRTAATTLALLAGPVLALAVGLTAHFVKTDREQIASILAEIAADVEGGRLAAVDRHMALECRMPTGGGGLNKAAILRASRTALRRYGVQRVSVAWSETIFPPGGAVTSAVTGVATRTGETIRVTWRLKWTKRQGAWQIVEVQLTAPQTAREAVY